MFHVIYRWTIHAGKEAQFEAAWAELTLLIRAHRGGLGSRLHRCADGSFLAYAQWPDLQTWERAAAVPLPESDALTRMKDAVLSREDPLPMTMVQDLLL